MLFIFSLLLSLVRQKDVFEIIQMSVCVCVGSSMKVWAGAALRSQEEDFFWPKKRNDSLIALLCQYTAEFELAGRRG